MSGVGVGGSYSIGGDLVPLLEQAEVEDVLDVRVGRGGVLLEYIYIYIYIYREREREMHAYVDTYR